MGDGFLKNMKLFALVDFGHQYRKIIQLINKIHDQVATEDVVYDVLGCTPKVTEMAKDLEIAFKTTHYSLWCLLYYDVNSFVIEKLRCTFDNLNMLAVCINDLSAFGLHESTINKIKFAIDNLKLNNCCDLESEIIRIIERNGIITNLQLKMFIFNKYLNIDSNMYESLIKSMICRDVIIDTINGFKLKKYNIKNFLEKTNFRNDDCVLLKCQGKTLEEIGNLKNLTRERVRQIIKKQVSSFPTFNNEKEYYDLKSNYLFTKNDIEILDLDKYLLEYVDLKYNYDKPEKNVIDYLKENKLCNTLKGKKIFAEHNLIIFENEILKNNFIDLFIKFVHKFKIVNFNLEEIAYHYNKYLVDNAISDPLLYIDCENLAITSRKLENSGKFLNSGARNFVLFDEDLLSSDFIEAARRFLDEVDGYCSSLLFLNNNKSLCYKNKIYDENQLFIIMKKMFSKEYEDSIDFIRNPNLCKKGVDRTTYIENFLLDMDLPCEVDDYLNYIYDVTGLKKASIASNFNNIINKYINADNLLSLDVEFSENEKDKFIECLNDRESIGLKLFEFQVKNIFDDRSNIFLNSNTIKKFGYIKTNTAVYKDKYQNRTEAVYSLLAKDKIILQINEIEAYTNIEFLTYRQYDTLKDCPVVKIGKDKFLNIIARNQQESIKELKRDLYELINDEDIYVLSNFMDSSMYKRFLRKEKEYNEILLAYNEEEILKFIISTTDGFYYLSQGETFIFSKSDISYESIVKRIMNENVSISLDEFREIMLEEYGITKSFTNSELSNMGYYCPYTSEKIYLNDTYYEQEIEEILNGTT